MSNDVQTEPLVSFVSLVAAYIFLLVFKESAKLFILYDFLKARRLMSGSFHMQRFPGIFVCSKRQRHCYKLYCILRCLFCYIFVLASCLRVKLLF